MKDKPNEWVTISDLMAGVMAVVMLLLVISVLQKTYAEVRHKEEIAKSQASQKNKVSGMLKDLQKSLQEQGNDSLVAFDIQAGKITLRDNVFDKGSACITVDAKNAIKTVEEKVAAFLAHSAQGQILVEGHTDSFPVGSPVTDFSRFCTVYDDNYTLSAARAREARKLLVASLSAENAKKVIVAGYGESQPLEGIPSTDARNRRVEVHFVAHEQSSK